MYLDYLLYLTLTTRSVPRKKEEKKCKIPEELLDHCYLHVYEDTFDQVIKCLLTKGYAGAFLRSGDQTTILTR